MDIAERFKQQVDRSNASLERACLQARVQTLEHTLAMDTLAFQLIADHRTPRPGRKDRSRRTQPHSEDHAMKTPHRWALLDKKGKNRGTCEAILRETAAGCFLGRRDGLPIPKGWRIVDRGPVEDDTLALAADPTPEPRAFKVGDEELRSATAQPGSDAERLG